MQLTDLQKDTVRQWAAEGASLSQIQDRLAQEFNVRMSFIEVRLLVLELQVAIKEKEREKEKLAQEPSEKVAPPGIAEETEDGEEIEEGGEAPASKVRVSLSRIAQPGFAVCGDVTFSDGTQAQWGLTTHGELSLGGTPPDYRPSPADLKEFQIQLRNLLS